MKKIILLLLLLTILGCGNKDKSIIKNVKSLKLKSGWTVEEITLHHMNGMKISAEDSKDPILLEYGKLANLIKSKEWSYGSNPSESIKYDSDYILNELTEDLTNTMKQKTGRWGGTVKSDLYYWFDQNMTKINRYNNAIDNVNNYKDKYITGKLLSSKDIVWSVADDGKGHEWVEASFRSDSLVLMVQVFPIVENDGYMWIQYEDIKPYMNRNYAINRAQSYWNAISSFENLNPEKIDVEKIKTLDIVKKMDSFKNK